jgi:hypothetical protein
LFEPKLDYVASERSRARPNSDAESTSGSLLLQQLVTYRPPAIRSAIFAIPLDESFLTCARSSVSEI